MSLVTCKAANKAKNSTSLYGKTYMNAAWIEESCMKTLYECIRKCFCFCEFKNKFVMQMKKYKNSSKSLSKYLNDQNLCYPNFHVPVPRNQCCKCRVIRPRTILALFCTPAQVTDRLLKYIFTSTG